MRRICLVLVALAALAAFPATTWATNSCCIPDARAADGMVCEQGITEAYCSGAGGDYYGTVECADNPQCPPFVAACCLLEGGCRDMGDDDCATGLGGTSVYGTCADAVCEPPPPPEPAPCSPAYWKNHPEDWDPTYGADPALCDVGAYMGVPPSCAQLWADLTATGPKNGELKQAAGTVLNERWVESNPGEDYPCPNETTTY